MGLRQITSALSDGTGLSQEELWLLVATAASLAVLYGVIRAVDAVLDLAGS